MSHKVFRDVIHNMISLQREGEEGSAAWRDWGDGLLLALIDTPEVQRLRRIRQLGPASRIYPNAEHSRFSHALGVMHLAKRILGAVAPGMVRPLEPEELLLAKVAALLHDIGHGPYSHLFEEVQVPSLSHESWGRRILLDEATGVYRVLHRGCRRLGLDFASFLDRLQAIFTELPPGESPSLVRQVISSQLDADRMDYLLRDAHFTGVIYGRYDLEWLLHSLRVQEEAGGERLTVDVSKGPAALESYLNARDHMYLQVYEHKTVRAFEVLFIHLFETLAWAFACDGGLPDGTPVELVDFLRPTASPGTAPSVQLFLTLDDAVLDYAVGVWARLRPGSVAQAELSWKSRLFHHRVATYRRLFWRMAPEAGSRQLPRVTDQIVDPLAVESLEAFLRRMGGEWVEVTDPDGERRRLPLGLVVRLDRLERAPYAHLRYVAGSLDAIHVVDGNGRVVGAEEVSERIHALGHPHRCLARVFVDPRAEGLVKTLVREGFSCPGMELVCDSQH
ncbi:MAG: HD domain-containing protein [Magnetococcales bacterium]|nr:HD domain-containing protein [Magnetococcales bacterium]